jgi:ParB family chromosome partitioning protein
MSKRPALGKGIGALLNSATHEGNRKYFLCPIEDLKPHSEQPRKSFDDAKLQELAASIREKGVIQPLVVRKVDDYYQIIAGERRWRAAQRAGLHEVPVVIQDVSEDWALEAALIENIQREDLNPIEESMAYRNLMQRFDLTQEEVAKRVGKERSTVANALRILRLPDAVQADVISGRLSMGHARALLALEDEGRIQQVRTRVIAGGLSVRETEALVKKSKNPETLKSRASARVTDPELDHLVAKLQRVLGTQVKIIPKGKGGRLEISYFAPADLDRLLEMLGVQ